MAFCLLLLLGTVTTVAAVQESSSCTCEPRYLKHYQTKGCTPVFEENSECQCPTRFDCPEINPDPNVCKLNGVTYQLGDPVNATSDCQICNCRQDIFHAGATIQCIGIDCPFSFRPPPANNGCYSEYEVGQCCPKNTCTPKTPETKVCEYGGKEYRLGQKIYPDNDPCLICRCTESWTGLNNDSCKVFNCDLDKEIYNFKRGCIPIYHEKTCCPIEYHCPPAVEDGSSNNEPVVRPPNAENQCYFNSAYYARGETLNISHTTNCVTCTCNTPPDFTCVHRSCPGPPNNDYKNCVPTFQPNTCCGVYTCTDPVVDVSVEGVPSNGGQEV